MIMRQRRPHVPSPVRLSLGVNIALVLLVAIISTGVVGSVLWWLVGQPSIVSGKQWSAKDSFDFAKIVLAIVGGIGGVVALVVSYRKQRLGEAAERREDARLIAEDFTRATEQLGSDKAPARLGGIYALERLAQSTPDQRQAVINVLCGYLRMPPEAGDSIATSKWPKDYVSNDIPAHEREVRLAAQRVIESHLRQPDGSDDPESGQFWPGMHINLRGSFLIGPRFSFAEFAQGEFSGSVIEGGEFHACTFKGRAFFAGVKFIGAIFFVANEVEGVGWFRDSLIGGRAYFNETKFHGFTTFENAVFMGHADFKGVEFRGFETNLDDLQFNSSHNLSKKNFIGPLPGNSAMLKEFPEESEDADV